MVKEAVSPSADLCEYDSPLATVPLQEERSLPFWQRDIPSEYGSLAVPELSERIAAAKATLGKRVIIPGHHYQREEIIRFADVRGDSFKLAQYAAGNPDAEYIVFCGVHFMAESADILSAPHQKVILPNMAAGCSMADMATPRDVLSCWQELTDAGLADDTLPVTYINSAASLKAFCGERGGAVCTSSNAPAIVRWALERKKRVLFFPDQHLGRITGLDMGISLDEMPVWNYALRPGSLGGNTLEDLQQSRIILWKGYCSVHQRFTVEQVQQARARFPDVKVVVHPECALDVIREADCYGSTEYIIKTVSGAPAGSHWAVGTEINLVSRLAHENPDKTVFCLDHEVCPCSSMYRIHPAYLCWVLERLVAGEVVNQVKVEPETARWAKLALERMLAIT